ncbi:MAG: outer membrane protein assembly factor BamE, partial [Lentisphaerae bacterium]|nr:outer membrane protein assembly factor BamE [Lentisphaerota bacterium]
MNSRISKLLVLIGAVAISGLFSGCIAFDRDTSLLAPHKWDDIERNRVNLGKLRTKMTKQEVLEIMGEPIKGETFCEDNVWWYYIRTTWTDFVTTRDE